MADADTARLCVQIIHSHFGPLTATVVNTLLTRGRLTLIQLVRLTSLKARTVRAAILILIQHNLLWHSQTEEGEVLEINVAECLMRLRFGRFVWQAEELFGKAAGAIIQLILDHGKLRPPDIINMVSVSDPKAASVYSQALLKLVLDRYLKPSTILSHRSPRDKRIKYEAEEKAKISNFPTAKELREARETAEARLRREEAEAENVGLKSMAKELTGYRSNKRKMVDDEVVDDEVHFRVNFEKFNIHIRNKLIESAVRQRFNSCAASVMRAVLKTTEEKQMNLHEARSDPTSVGAIAMHIPDEVDLSAGLVIPLKSPSKAVLVKNYLGILSSADNPTLSGRASSFVSLTDSKVYVEFEIVNRRLRRRVLEAVTRERHGDDGVRILRLLLDTGKMDEKQVSKIAMMANKDVRPLLSALSSDSLISIQEIPRSADRNPTRTFYLWFVDLNKAYSSLLRSLYKTLYNISLRRQAEQDDVNVKAVLEKRERSDVSQDENLLTRMEREVLREWESKREKLTVLEMRVEEAVFILGDLDSGENSDSSIF